MYKKNKLICRYNVDQSPLPFLTFNKINRLQKTLLSVLENKYIILIEYTEDKLKLLLNK